MALAGLLGVFLSDERTAPVERVAVGGTGDSVAPGAGAGVDALPDIELVGTSMETPRRASPAGAGGDDQRAVPAGAADRLREPVPMPPESPARPYISDDPNTYPRFGTGFGDRD